MSDAHDHQHGPNCSHGHDHGHSHVPKADGKRLIWGVAIAAVAGIGAYLVSKYGEKSAADNAQSTDGNDWKERIRSSESANKSR